MLHDCFLAGVAAVLPERCLPPALAAIPDATGPTVLLAVGKAAPGMALAIAAALTDRGTPPANTLVIGLQPGPGLLTGDHPVPGARSSRAAVAIAEWVAALPPDAEVHIAISGGATSLIAAPLPGLAGTDLQDVFAFLLRSGLDVATVNAVRKRLTRWGAGRLAAAVAPRKTFAWVISDVPGDDPATIGSGPCTGDPWQSTSLRSALESTAVWQHLAPVVRAAIEVETLKPGARELGDVQLQIVARNHDAISAAATFAANHGCAVRQSSRRITGEARTAGEAIVSDLITARSKMRAPLEVIVHGGESVVTLSEVFGVGGRNQELALAAARSLAQADVGEGTLLLAAGTDGKDGSSSAAGAIVDGLTWRAIASRGHDPDALLERHQSDRAFEAVGAQLITGPTGTNVMDLAIGLNVERVRLD
ncbi:MAG: DUF4147 domain-containing protein [Gemmatimonadota bacterium]